MTKYILKILAVPGELWLWFVSGLPGQLGLFLRGRYWAKRLRSLGKNVRIDPGVYIQNPKFVSIGDNTWIDRGVVILAGADKSERPRTILANKKFPLQRGEIHIGNYIHIAQQCIISGIGGIYLSDFCSLAAGVKMFSFTHHYRSNIDPNNRGIYFSPTVGQDNQYMIEGPIYLEENVGVAVHSVILPGVTIEKDSFVAINSLVQSSFDKNSLISGNPARKIKDRYVSVGKVTMAKE